MHIPKLLANKRIIFGSDYIHIQLHRFICSKFSSKRTSIQPFSFLRSSHFEKRGFNPQNIMKHSHINIYIFKKIDEKKGGSNSQNKVYFIKICKTSCWCCLQYFYHFFTIARLLFTEKKYLS